MTYSYQDNYLALNPHRAEEVKSCSQRINQLIDSWNKTSVNSQDYKILHPIALDGYDELAALAAHIKKNFANVVIVGIGGSALNPKMTASLGVSAKISYLDTTDPFYYNAVMSSIDINDTYFLVISKSGKTIEVLSILGAILNDLGEQHQHQFCFIAGKGDNPLRTIAAKMGAKILDHDDYIGGRFATFTNVGILPGLLAGLDMHKFIEGANTVITSMWRDKAASLPAMAARSIYLFDRPIMVNIGYLRSFLDFFNWYSQIIAESLGKDGKGYTPIQNIGPIDQHSMFQLYLDGPRDKIYTFIYTTDPSKPQQNIRGIDFLQGKTLSDINDIEYKATLTSCHESKLPTRSISLPTIDEYNLGALAMHSILEITILGHLTQVNPFGQPGVEKIKTNINALL